MEKHQEQGVRGPQGVDPWSDAEEVRRQRLERDGERPLAVNLAEGLALAEYLARFTGKRVEELSTPPRVA